MCPLSFNENRNLWRTEDWQISSTILKVDVHLRQNPYLLNHRQPSRAEKELQVCGARASNVNLPIIWHSQSFLLSMRWASDFIYLQLTFQHKRLCYD